MSPEQHVCDGCGNSASSFQCPLCQAEAVTSRGFFCGQECFAKNWLKHRGTFHKSGVARVREQAPSTAVEDSTNRRKRAVGEATSTTDADRNKKRKLKRTYKEDSEVKKEDVNDNVKMPVVVPWSVLPRVSDTIATVEPPLPLGIARAVIGGSSLDRRVAFWSACVAAAHHIAAELEHQKGNKSSLCVLVITNGPLEAGAMAWALRCTGLAGVMRLILSTEAEDLAMNPSSHYSGNVRIVVTTESIMQCVSDGSASTWLREAESLLVTLPGVAEAADFQSVHTRALFFVYRGVSINTTDDAWCVEEEISHHVVPLQEAPDKPHNLLNSVAFPPVSASLDDMDTDTTPAHSSSLTTENTGGARTGRAFRFDNEISTFLARGDFPSALQQFVRLYSSRRGVFEEILFNSFLSTLGAASVAHAHHMLAYALRYFVDHSSRFKSPQGGTLKEMALRVISKIVRLLPPITASDYDDEQKQQQQHEENYQTEEKSKTGRVVTSSVAHTNSTMVPLPSALEKYRLFNYYEKLPNLQLQATMCYLYPHASPGTMDVFGTAWGVKKILCGPEALKHADQKRNNAVQRLRNRYGTKLGPAFANYLVVLMHFLYDTVTSYSLGVEEVEQRTLWSVMLAGEVGSLETFLSNCFLLQKDETMLTSEGVGIKKKQITTLSGRQIPQKPLSRTVLLRSQAVRTAVVEEPVQLSWVDLPLTGKRQREVERLQHQAVDEILMAMPRVPRPMYIGDVGNLIGKWFRFNARFDGALGVSLMEFLMQHPEAFRVVGNLVTRRTAGVADQVKMRFDNDSDNENDGDDSDGDRKAKDRTLLTGVGRKSGGKPGKDLPARARKKAMVKAFNKTRFNRNYKPIDESAKVPGYIKRGPRKVKGRGRKANLRNCKRG